MRWASGIGRAAATSLALWIVFGIAYILLRSRQYTAVDGALRCLAIYWRRPPYLGPNNHLLYPADVWLWAHAVGFFGVHPAEPIAFVRTVQTMNALCAGGCIALLNLIAWRFTGALKLSLAAAVGYALTWTVLKHAANSAEPVIGLFISLIAAGLVIEGLFRARPGLLFAGGAGLALALANYQSMFLIAPVLYLLCLIWPLRGASPDDARQAELSFPASLPALRRSIPRLTACVGGTIAGAIVIYGAAYYTIGLRGPWQMLRAFVQFRDDRVYGGFALSKLVNLPIGLIGNLLAVLPADYQGIGWFLVRHRDARAIAVVVAIAIIVAVALAMLAFAVVRRCGSRGSRLVGLAVSAALLLDLFVVVYRDPLYDKFWLQPLAILFVCGAIAASWMEPGALRRFSIVAMLLIGLEVLVNLPDAIAAHSNPAPCLDDARNVAEAVRPDDRVVADFDPVSTLWMALYDRQPSRTMLLPATQPAVAFGTLERWREECSRSGCRIFFVGVLDQSKDQWDPFLGKRIGIPFDSFDRYRDASRIVDRFACEGSGLRIYQPPRSPVSPRSLGN